MRYKTTPKADQDIVDTCVYGAGAFGIDQRIKETLYGTGI